MVNFFVKDQWFNLEVYSNTKRCHNCASRYGWYLTEVVFALQNFYQSIVLQETNGINEIFEFNPNVILTVTKNCYKINNYNVIIPYVMGGKLHYIYEKEGGQIEINYNYYKTLKQPLLSCFFCYLDKNPMGYQNLPGSFFIKNKQYYCPTLVTPDNRRPHYNKQEDCMMFYRFSEKIMFSQLERLRETFYLNHLGNMKFCSVGYLFPMLMLKKILRIPKLNEDKRKKKAIEHHVQTYINTGAIEVAISNRNNYTVTGKIVCDNKFLQKRVTEIINSGYSPYSNRYKEVLVGNDFSSIHCPLECFKLITKNVTSHEHQAYGDSDVGFFDPIFTCDGENVGRVTSLCKNVVISWASHSANEIFDFIKFHTDKSLQTKTNCSISLLMINFGEIIENVSFDFKHDLIILLKSKFFTIEILQYDDFLCVNSKPLIIYKKCKNGLYYTPQELAIVKKNLESCESYLDFINNEIFGSISLPIPFPQHILATKDQYVVNTQKQVTQIYLQYRTKFPTPTKIWSLVYPQTPFFSNCSFPLFTIWCTAAVMCVDGFNQEDGIVVKKSSVERGMFSSERYGHYKLSYELMENSKLFINLHILPNEILSNKKVIFEISNVNSVTSFHVEMNVRRSKKTVFILYWNAIENRKLFNIYIDKINHAINIITRDFEYLAVGDKVMAETGQKFTVTAIISDENLPFVQTKCFSGIPDVFIHPASLKRQPLAMYLEGINREKNAQNLKIADYNILQKKVSVQDNLTFPFLEHAFYRPIETIKRLYKSVEDKYTGTVFCGMSGKKLNCNISILNMTFQILPQHNAKEKEYAVGSKAREDFLTGQKCKGKSHMGGLGISNMETEVLIGHGVISTLENLLFERSDDVQINIDFNTFIRAGSSSQRFLDDMRLLDITPKVKIEPSISEL